MVVLIIGITAALATPSVVNQLRERHSRTTAQEISQVFVGARMRAMGRGTAVMVRYTSAGFQVIESIEGTQAEGRGQNNCTSAPGFGCLSTQWGEPKNWREVDSFTPRSDLIVEAFKLGAAGAKAQLNVCFSPGGRSFYSEDGNPPTSAFTGLLEFQVQRQNQTVRTGVLRKVVMLPNGNARIAL